MAIPVVSIIKNVIEWGPVVAKFGKDAWSLVKKGWDINKLNFEIKRNESLIINAKYNIGTRFVEKKMTTSDIAIKDELLRIKKCKEEISKYERAKEAIKVIKDRDLVNNIDSLNDIIGKNKTKIDDETKKYVSIAKKKRKIM